MQITSFCIKILTENKNFGKINKNICDKLSYTLNIHTVYLRCCFYFWIHWTYLFCQLFSRTFVILKELSYNIFIYFKDIAWILIIKFFQIFNLFLYVNIKASNWSSFWFCAFMLVFSFFFHLIIVNILKFAFKEHCWTVQYIQYLCADALFQNLISIECGL